MESAKKKIIFLFEETLAANAGLTVDDFKENVPPGTIVSSSSVQHLLKRVQKF